ncbi:MAG: PAS domain-containing protein, partial [Oscillochloris sp.]|nr:PAS domain-containing protein [Oscillochloris sp.]
MSTLHRTRHYIGRHIHALRARLAVAERTIETQQQALDTLQRLTALTLHDQPFPIIIKAVAQTLSAATGFPIVTIELYHATLQQMEVVAASGCSLPADEADRRAPLDQTLAGQALRSGQIIVEAEAQRLASYADAIVRQAEVQTVICVPLVSAGQMLGTLTLAHPARVAVDNQLVALSESLATTTALLVARYRADTVILRHSEHTFRDLFEHMRDAFVLVDIQGTICKYNRSFQDLLGYSDEELRQLSYQALTPARWHAAEARIVEEEVLRQGYSGVYEKEYRRKDGSIVPIELRTVLTRDDQGRPSGMWGIIRDITERRQTEALLIAQRDLTRMIASATSPEDALPRCLDLAQQVTGMDSGGVYLFDPDQQALELIYHQGLGEHFVGTVMRYPIDTPQAQLLLSCQAPYYTYTHDDINRLGALSSEGLYALAIIPIYDHKGVLGCINLGSHSLTHIPDFMGQALQTIGTEIGNMVIYLRTVSALRESQARTEMALKAAKLGMWDWEVQTGRVVFNERWAGIVGYTLDELAPLSFATWTSLCHPVDLERSKQLLQEHIVGDREFYECEIRMRHRDGSWVWVISHGQVVEWDSEGLPVRMTGTHLDISARKAADLALRELNQELERRVAERTAALQASQDRLALAARSAGIGIWDWDIVANTLSWDERMYELYGVASADFGSAYEAWFNGLHPDDRAEAERVSLSTRRGEQEYDTEFRVCHPDGTIRVLKAYAYIERNAAGEALRMVGVNFDITERKQAEATLRQANRDMARAAQMKDEFLANMSHELRSPLNAILGFSENLQEGIYGTLNERQQAALHHIEASGQHLLTLITDILDLSKVEAGQMSIAPERIKIADVCRASQLFVNQMALKKSIQLSFEIGDLGTTMEADPKRLKQIL